MAIGFCPICKAHLNASFCTKCHVEPVLDEQFEPHTFASDEEEAEFKKKREAVLRRRAGYKETEAVRATLEDIMRKHKEIMAQHEADRAARKDAAPAKSNAPAHKYRSGRKS